MFGEAVNPAARASALYPEVEMDRCHEYELLTSSIAASRQAMLSSDQVTRLSAGFDAEETRARRMLHVTGCPTCSAAQRAAARAAYAMVRA